tara:strand:- start:65 stop:787 length:723 start_codon:yes stop_codon:yes gene_type:complete
MDMLIKVASTLGSITLIVGVLGGAVWAFLKLFSEKMIESKFSKELEAFKHVQQRELEQLKFAINSSLDRTSKLHQHEFETLPEAWRLLHQAFGDSARLFNRFQSYSDLQRMESAQLNEFLEKIDLPLWQKEKLAQATDKNTLYFEYDKFFKLNRATQSHAALHNYILEKGIFIQRPLAASMREIANNIAEALIERSIDFDSPAPGPDRFAKGDKVLRETPKLIEEIGQQVQERLWTATIQ